LHAVRIVGLLVFLFVLVAVLAIARSFIFESPLSSITGAAISQENTPTKQITVPQEIDSKVKSLASSPLIQDLPKKAVI